MSKSPRSPYSYQTYSGIWVDPFDLHPEDIRIVDMAHSLAGKGRFSSHTDPYYVAEHSVHCSKLIRLEKSLKALLHDGAETYFMDVPTVIKRHPALASYKEYEDKAQRVVFQAFGLDASLDDPEIKLVDLMMLKREARALKYTLNESESWLNKIPNLDWLKLEFWTPKQAEAAFLSRFWDLLGNKSQESLMKEEVLVEPI